MINDAIPNKYVITGHFVNEQDFLKKLDYILSQGFKLIQIRAKKLSQNEYVSLAKKAMHLKKKDPSIKFILNANPEILNLLEADGVHLTSEYLIKLNKRPLPNNKIVSAACHNLDELKKAEQLKVNFVTLSPVLKTQTHPDAISLGWNDFKHLSKNCSLPVFALGGMRDELLKTAQNHGAHGIASLSWWREKIFDKIN